MSPDTEKAFVQSWALLAGADGVLKSEEESLIASVNAARSFVPDTALAVKSVAEAVRMLPAKKPAFLADINRHMGPLNTEIKAAALMSWVLLAQADSEIVAGEVDTMAKLVEAADIDRQTVVLVMMRYIASRR